MRLVRIECFVGDEGVGRNVADENRSLCHVMNLSGRQGEAMQTTQSLHECMNLGAQSATGTTERLRAVFFRAPAACWWARTMVESRNASLKSASFANSLKTRCHTPLSDQRAKRWYTLFQGPNSSGISRHGLPVRATHSTDSTKSRLSAAVRPGSETFPGNIAWIRRHCSLRKIVRTNYPTPSASWGETIALIVNRTYYYGRKVFPHRSMFVTHALASLGLGEAPLDDLPFPVDHLLI